MSKIGLSMDSFIELIGTIAGACTTLAFLPQVLHVWKTRSVRDISLGMYTIFCSGVFLWTVYGFLKNAWPLIIANIATLVLAAAVLVMKILWSKKS